jgi:uncharacterized protein with FMN-binding domain
MKRALLIAGGTVGGLGAVLAVTPPQFGSSETSLAIGGTTAAPVSSITTDAGTATEATPSQSADTTQSAPATKSANSTTKTVAPSQSASATATPSKSATPSASASVSATPTPTATKSTSTKSVSGTFTGDAINVGYGIVQVQITVNNGKITDAQAVQAPNGRNDRWTQMSVPVLRQKTLAAQSANITGVSGASYTSYGWYKSLVSALSKAGL